MSAEQELTGQPRAQGVTLHLCPEGHWAAHDGKEHYLPERFGEEGFVHCTNGEDEVIAVGNRYYRADTRPFLLLDVDLDHVAAPAIYEDPDQLYPHIYGPIDTAAVRRVRRIVRDGAGGFVGVADIGGNPAS